MTHHCWNQIGVTGDRSCPELKTFIHCRNCPVYSAAGRRLLEREIPAGYLEEWTHLLRSETETTHHVASTGPLSVVIFRLANEWLALPAKLFKEVTDLSPIHTLPHRSNQIFLGLVSIRGEIQVCISLKALLGLEAGENQSLPTTHERMVVVEKEASRWVFLVDEIYGIHRFHADEFGNVPATVAKVPETYTKGILNWQNQNVSYLDDELLFYILNKKLL